MKTVHVHHDGQYWRGFRHGLFAFALGVMVATFVMAQNQAARSGNLSPECPDGTHFRGMQGRIALCELQPVNADKQILPMPVWWSAYPGAERLTGDTLRELDKHGLRPAPASKTKNAE